ncbi:MAG: hypothetical protein IT581_12415 [Verrucomicrobiales bacterium]|nr:hypothetical protein [Verrucomicrobiales bacterium]
MTVFARMGIWRSILHSWGFPVTLLWDRVARAMLLAGIFLSSTLPEARAGVFAEIWYQRQPVAGFPDLHDVVWGDGHFVAVGNGIVLRSADGSQWSTRAASDTFELTRVRDFNGYLFAVGRMTQQGLRIPCYARIARDGAFMNLGQLPTRLRPRSLAWGASSAVVVGDRGLILTTTNRLTDTPIPTAPGPATNMWRVINPAVVASQSLLDVAFGFGLFVAVGERQQIWTSPDGLSWTLRHGPAEGAFHAVSVTADAFFVMGDGGELLRSNDGMTWTTLPKIPGVGRSLAVLDGRFVMAGAPILNSDDRINWGQPSGVAGYQTRALAYSSPLRRFVSVGLAGTIVGLNSAGSEGKPQRYRVPLEIGGIVYAREKFVTGSLTSTNGVVWKRNDGHQIGDLGFANGVFWGTELNGSMQGVGLARSDDGHHWTRVLSATNIPKSRMVFARGYYHYLSVRVPGFGLVQPTVERSADGVFWRSTDLPVSPVSSQPYTLIAEGNDRLVIVSPTQPCLVSTNGLEWSLPPAGISELTRLEFANGAFHGVGSTGDIFRSNDGRDWSNVTQSVVPTIYPVQQFDGEWVSFTADGRLLRSANGTDWSARVINTTANTLRDFAASPGNLVAVGDNGTLLQAGDIRDLPVEIADVRRFPDGVVRVHFTGPPGIPVVLQRSSDLMKWGPATRAENMTGEVVVDDFGTIGAPAAFYRVGAGLFDQN